MNLALTMDAVRAQVGVVYPQDADKPAAEQDAILGANAAAFLGLKI